MKFQTIMVTRPNSVVADGKIQDLPILRGVTLHKRSNSKRFLRFYRIANPKNLVMGGRLELANAIANPKSFNCEGSCE